MLIAKRCQTVVPSAHYERARLRRTLSTVQESRRRLILALVVVAGLGFLTIVGVIAFAYIWTGSMMR